ncbi:TPA: hypothetical protein ACH3X1_001943 [Trebouxia sp. C0004]
MSKGCVCVCVCACVRACVCVYVCVGHMTRGELASSPNNGSKGCGQESATMAAADMMIGGQLNGLAATCLQWGQCQLPSNLYKAATCCKWSPLAQVCMHDVPLGVA